MRSFFLVLIAVTLFYPCVYSQNNKELDLFKGIEIASDSSLQAFLTQNYYQSGYWDYRDYKAARLPSLSLRSTPLQYNRNIVKRYDFQENIDVYRSQQFLYSSGGMTLSQNLDFTGGTFFADSEIGYIKSSGDNKNKQFNAIPIRIGYSQALFGFNSFKWERKIEPLKFEKVKKIFLYRQQEIAETTVQYFFNYAQAQKEYELALENLLTADTLYTIGLERQKISAISEADVLSLKLDKINTKNTLKSVELVLKNARFAYLHFLNLDKGMEYSIHLPEKLDNILIPIGNALMYSRTNNPDYLGYRQELLEAEREVDRTHASVFDASISASLGFNQVADNFAGAYSRPLQQDLVAVSLTIPILDWGIRKGRKNMAKSNLVVTKFSVQQKKQNLEQQLTSVVDDFNNQKELIGSAQEILSLAKSAYRINQKRFVIGKADMSALSFSLNRYKDAQRNYVNSLKNYWASYYKIKKLTLYDFSKHQDLSVLLEKNINNLHEK